MYSEYAIFWYSLRRTRPDRTFSSNLEKLKHAAGRPTEWTQIPLNVSPVVLQHVGSMLDEEIVEDNTSFFLERQLAQNKS